MAAVKTYTDDLENLDESYLEDLYAWVDQIPLTRPKRNISRDFSDGVMVAELVHHFLPSIVQLHNFTPANSTPKKLENWHLLDRKVFSKLNFSLTEDLIRDICLCKINLVERFLKLLREKIDKALYHMNKEAGARTEMAHSQRKANSRLNNPKAIRGTVNDKPEADQNIDTSNYSSNYVDTVPSKTQNKTVTVSPGRGKGQQPGPYKGAGKIKMIDEVIPRVMYEEKEQECLAKEETIQILQAKVRRLEHLLHLKDIRIEDLQNKIESTRPTGLMKRKQ